MKNLKMSYKILFTALIGVVGSVIVCAFGIIGMINLNASTHTMYTEGIEPVEYAATMYDELANQRITLSNAIIFRENNPEFASGERAALTEEKEPNFVAAMENFAELTKSDPEISAVNKSLSDYYYSEFAAAKKAVLDAIDSGNSVAITTAMEAFDGSASDVSDFVTEGMMGVVELGKTANTEADSVFNMYLIIIIAVFGVFAAIAVIFALYMSRVLSNAMKLITRVASGIAERGQLDFDPETTKAVRDSASQKDEVGHTYAAFVNMLRRLRECSDALVMVAEKDLRVDITALSEDDRMGKSIETMIVKLSESMGEIDRVAEQMDTASAQMANAAQSLAEGAQEQSVSVSTLDRTISEILEQNTQGNVYTDEAETISRSIMVGAEKSESQMRDMVKAMNSISDASDNISKVIKVIDDIAFQTNILALNAAVEAARAGQHGKGFAVVAEEVRNLAAKSASAAKDTTDLINESITKAQSGMQIATDTSKSLETIVQGIRKNSDTIAEIGRLSRMRDEALHGIAGNVRSISDVVNANVAASEQTSASSTEMNNQADILADTVREFKLKDAVFQLNP
ncbi:MAG: methyl-accepting chemotaxis protein [Oscillospiraceae bacterium]|jgi:methyl-accepting chemotaxis protein|nr:methyl-accepting chemotaxis protein [Oscillospiraceae bacterium]